MREGEEWKGEGGGTETVHCMKVSEGVESRRQLADLTGSHSHGTYPLLMKTDEGKLGVAALVLGAEHGLGGRTKAPHTCSCTSRILN